ncbi:unnamed protein product [Chrysoparadoxa australica]
MVNGLQMVDYETGKWTKALTFAGEPLFVPRGKEEMDGQILSYGYDSQSHTSQLVIVDAAKFEKGAVGTCQLPIHLLHSFHDCWTTNSGAG